jgi:hypothetical protein
MERPMCFKLPIQVLQLIHEMLTLVGDIKWDKYKLQSAFAEHKSEKMTSRVIKSLLPDHELKTNYIHPQLRFAGITLDMLQLRYFIRY